MPPDFFLGSVHVPSPLPGLPLGVCSQILFSLSVPLPFYIRSILLCSFCVFFFCASPTLIFPSFCASELPNLPFFLCFLISLPLFPSVPHHYPAILIAVYRIPENALSFFSLAVSLFSLLPTRLSLYRISQKSTSSLLPAPFCPSVYRLLAFKH